MTPYLVTGILCALELWIVWNYRRVERWKLWRCSCGCWATTYYVWWKFFVVLLWPRPLIRRVEALHVERAILRM